MKLKKSKIKRIFVIQIILIFILIILNNTKSLPFGTGVYYINSSHPIPDPPQNITATAGNVTEINIGGISITRSWQGYFGNVTGGIILADASGNVLYNWSILDYSYGEVYASRNDSIIWDNVQCFNFTATGTFEDDSMNRGNTSYYGMNITQLEKIYNILSDDIDGVDETFNLNDHSLFYTNNLEFRQGECKNTRLIGNNGEKIFEEILLYSPDNREIIFVSIINNDKIGFDGRIHDFQMIVLEDGHGSDTQSTPYFFYLELG